MSIHKSKGLEFPVVFVANLHKPFNKMDMRQSILLHEELGIGTDYIQHEKRLRKESVFSKAIKIKMKRELLSEELRILYVALTRAKEKLYLVGVLKDFEGKNRENLELWKEEDMPYASHQVSSQPSFLDMLLISCPYEQHECYRRYLLTPHQIGTERVFGLMADLQERKELLDYLSLEIEEKEELETIEKEYIRMIKPYAYEKASKVPISLSVTELKRKKISLLEEESSVAEEFVQVETFEKKTLAFLEKKKRKVFTMGL